MISVSFRPGSRRSLQVPDKNEYFLVNWRTSSNPHVWHPPTDVYEREESIDVRVEIAGMAEDNFSISLEQNILVIRGIRPDIADRRAYHQMEINFGEFLSAIEIQVPIDSEHVRAEYQNGFLWVILPKSQPKVIKVKENE
jgi:HSP20 family protein